MRISDCTGWPNLIKAGLQLWWCAYVLPTLHLEKSQQDKNSLYTLCFLFLQLDGEHTCDAYFFWDWNLSEMHRHYMFPVLFLVFMCLVFAWESICCVYACFLLAGRLPEASKISTDRNKSFEVSLSLSVQYGHCLPGSKSCGRWVCHTSLFCQLGIVPCSYSTFANICFGKSACSIGRNKHIIHKWTIYEFSWCSIAS